MERKIIHISNLEAVLMSKESSGFTDTQQFICIRLSIMLDQLINKVNEIDTFDFIS